MPAKNPRLKSETAPNARATSWDIAAYYFFLANGFAFFAFAPPVFFAANFFCCALKAGCLMPLFAMASTLSV